MASTVSSSRSRNYLFGSIAAFSLVIASGYYLYSSFTTSTTTDSRRLSQPTNSTGKSTKPSAKIALVVSRSLLENGIPLGALLEKYSDLVIILTPNVSGPACLQLHSQIPSDQSFKLIPCETQIGISHVLKHLRSDIVVLPHDIPQTVPSDIERFVGSITILSNDVSTASNELAKLFFT